MLEEKIKENIWSKLKEPRSKTYLEFPFEYTFTTDDLDLFRHKKSFGGLGFGWVYISDDEIYVIRGGTCYYRLSIKPEQVVHSARLFIYADSDETDVVLKWIKEFNPKWILSCMLKNWTGHSAFPEYEGMRIESAKDLPLEHLELPYWVKKRIQLATGNDVTVGFFKNPLIVWYSIVQDFDVCVLIAEKVSGLGFYVPELKDLAKTKMKLDSKRCAGLIELKISDRLLGLIEEAGVKTIDQLISYSAKGLDERGIVNYVGLKELREALQRRHLLLRDDYLIKCSCCGKLFADDSPKENLCGECKNTPSSSSYIEYSI